ncbi:acyl-CoA carboxylase subunit beta [Gephyromycinifex aptenodytis]|uniref:acyl-CoA carboxylase subunit beta n=1 Tax=Gephyromycinifex aptenodytis TaxID=2716227 RepID=UPI001446F1D5|nr:acyl-CoA carboxylase subunit beta [Gephyromycinifex aptenodytis]
MPQNDRDELRRRRLEAEAGGGEAAVLKRRERGLLTARQRLDRLFQRSTFQESGLHVHHRSVELGDKELPADGVVTGTGYVKGQLVAAFAQDATVAAGSLGEMHAKKIIDTMKTATRVGVPLVAFQESAGARIQEGVDALSGYGKVFYHNVLMSGVVPQIAVICGPCAGGAAYSPALMDFIIMTKQNAHMFITGPDVIKSVTGRQTTMEEIGGAQMHASVSGNVHFLAEDDDDAIRIVKALLEFLPPNNTDDPPHDLVADLRLGRDEGMNGLVPDDPTTPMDVRAVITRIVDNGYLLEVQAQFAQNLIVGFARIEGMVVGIIANQPTHLAGALDIDASDKGARFIRFCNAFNIPLVTLVDVPGFLPGIEQERGGIIRHGAKMLFAYASGTVPKLTVILRKAYGGSYLAMCSKEMGTDYVYAWPNAEIAVMGGAGAANILYKRELQEAEDPEAKRVELVQRYREEHATPYRSAARGYITDVIDPSETRAALALSLRKTLSKRELRPAKKHGNIPL